MSPFPRRLAALTAARTVAIVTAAGWLALREGTPAAVPRLVFGVITTFCIRRDVPIADGIDVSAGPMVATASVGVFAADHWLLGPTPATR